MQVDAGMAYLPDAGFCSHGECLVRLVLLVPLVPFGICSPCGTFWKSHPDFGNVFFCFSRVLSTCREGTPRFVVSFLGLPCSLLLHHTVCLTVIFWLGCGCLWGAPPVLGPAHQGLTWFFSVVCVFCGLLIASYPG